MNRRLIVGVANFGVAAVVLLAVPATTSSRPLERSQAVEPAASSRQHHGCAFRAETRSDVASYWTPERMRAAQPMEKSVPAAGQSARRRTAKTAPRVVQAPAAVPETKAAPTKTSTKKSVVKQASASGPGSGPTSTPASGNAAEYWTKERMDGAQGMGKTVPGDSAGSTLGSTDDGGELVLVAP